MTLTIFFFLAILVLYTKLMKIFGLIGKQEYFTSEYIQLEMQTEFYYCTCPECTSHHNSFIGQEKMQRLRKRTCTKYFYIIMKVN